MKTLILMRFLLSQERSLNFQLSTVVLLTFLLLTFNSRAQNVIITDDENYSPTSTNALLELKPVSNDKGILVPRLTTAQRTAMTPDANADKGLMVYDTDTQSFWYYNSTAWVEIGASTSGLEDADDDTKIQVEESADEDNIRFDVAGTEAMVIDENGRVGIGTDNPGAKLEIAKVATNANEDALKIGIDGEYAASIKFFDDDDETNEHFTIKYDASSENLLLGSDQVNDILDINGNYTLVGSYYSGLDNICVYVSGKYAYVGTGNGLQIFDISNPTSPSLIGNYISGYGMGVHVSGKYVYLAVQGGSSPGIKIIDISNPTSPTLAGSYNLSPDYKDVYVSGMYLYAANGLYGLMIIDISNPSNPTLTGSYNTSGHAEGIYISGKYAYVADYSPGLLIIDISNPSNPTLTASCNTGGAVKDVVVSGKYAYVANLNSGLQIIDIGNPTSPSISGVCNTGGSAKKVFVSGKYAFLTHKDGYGLKVINISNPANPFLTGSYNTINDATGVYVSGTYAYMTEIIYGLHIIDIVGISTPAMDAGNIASDAITVSENLDVGNNLYVHNGINVGPGGIKCDGPISFNFGNIIQESGYYHTTDEVRAIDNDGLKLFDDDENGIFIQDGGNIGIGTTSPSQKLEVNGAVKIGTYTLPSTDGTSGQFLKTDGSGSVSWSADNTISNWTENSGNIYRNSGNVGVGTTSPSQKLEVNGAVKIGAYTLPSIDGTNGQLLKTDGSGNISWSDDNNTTNWSENSGNIYRSSGNIGIGTSTPDGILDIQTEAGYYNETADQLNDYATNDFNEPSLFWQSFTAGQTGYIGKIEVWDDGNSVGTFTMKLYSGEGDNGTLLGTSNSVSRNNSGSAYVTFSFSSPVSVTGTQQYTFAVEVSGTYWEMAIRTGNGYSGGKLFYDNNEEPFEDTKFKTYVSQYNDGIAMIVDTNSNVGIGTTTPNYKLEVNGSAGKPGGGSWSNSSDRRLKDLHGDYKKGLNEILELSPVLFNYKKDNPRELPDDIIYQGFVAQEVQKIFPEAVSQGEDGYLDFNMHSINVALVNAIKELKQENDSLKTSLAKLANLESDVQELKALFGQTAKNE
jgi:hypothetical protein